MQLNYSQLQQAATSKAATKGGTRQKAPPVQRKGLTAKRRLDATIITATLTIH